MRLRDIVPERADQIELARARETAVGRAYEGAIRAVMEQTLKSMRKQPKMNSTDIKADVRYMFGLLDGLEFVLGLSDEALDEISK